jgi:hypothetical protein
MSEKAIESIANSVFYEGYLLYPYRSSAIKNRQRWNFGIVYPKARSGQGDGTEPHMMQTECLVRAAESTHVSVTARFLQLYPRSSPVMAETADRPESELAPLREEVLERQSVLPSTPLNTLQSETVARDFSFPEELRGSLEVSAAACGDGLFRLRVQISNLTPTDEVNEPEREQRLGKCLISTHTILHVEGGEFVSLMDPPPAAKDAAAACQNIGTWPVLVGEEGSKDAMLSSPIILYDYPQIAPESPGDLFDATEIDEILALRILTLSDEEKREILEGDARAREVLQRTESLPVEHLLKLHGVLRGVQPHEEKHQPKHGDAA